MKLSKLNELPTTREMIDVFRGYNHNLRISEGEFYDMENLTSADYPVLSPRPKRGVYKNDGNIQGMVAKDALCYVDGDRLYINGEEIGDTETADMSLTVECNTCPHKYTCESYTKDSTRCQKTLISMGAYIIIMPDKKYVNTQNHFDCGNIEASFDATGEVEFILSKLDGEAYNIPDSHKSATIPPLPKDAEGNDKEEYDDLTLWLDMSGDHHVIKQYSKSSGQWVSIATTYIKIIFKNTTVDLTKAFSDGDGLTIKGIKDLTTNQQLLDLENTMVVWEVGTNYLIVTGILDKTETLNVDGNPIQITRAMPNMDFIIESGNRLWGCRYGTALNGEVVNEIYASKLGDFKNWNCFASISTDSYVATVGSDGQFTGAITHLGYPIFFKENYLHKVYGNYPANYQIQTTACRGVQKGCSKSLAIVNETLYYKARSAVCAYDGSLPVEMSSALGDMTYGDAVAGVLGNKYYISMRDLSKTDTIEYHLFVYDALRGMWHREDDRQVVEFCNCRGELYFLDYDDKCIKTVRGSGTPEKYPVKWSAITGLIGTDSPDKKYISRLIVRLSLEVGTKVYIFAQYDSSGAWEHLFTMNGTSLKTFSIPIRPKRCDHMRLKIEGEGEAKIYSITKTIEQGSDV